MPILMPDVSNHVGDPFDYLTNALSPSEIQPVGWQLY